MTFHDGVTYVLALTGKNLSVRGSNGSTATASLPSSKDTVHTFVGSMIFADSTTTVRLYPKLSLAPTAPAVGTNGVLQGETYSVRLLYGSTDKSAIDIIDANQTSIASGVAITTPKPTDKSSPRKGDQYFGSFVGGDTTLTVWSVPVFLMVSPSNLPAPEPSAP